MGTIESLKGPETGSVEGSGAHQLSEGGVALAETIQVEEVDIDPFPSVTEYWGD